MSGLAPPGAVVIDTHRARPWLLALAGLVVLASLLPMSQEEPIDGWWFDDHESMWIVAWEVNEPSIRFQLDQLWQDNRAWAVAIALAGPVLALGTAGLVALPWPWQRWLALGVQASSLGLYAAGVAGRNVALRGQDALDSFVIMPGFYILAGMLVVEGLLLAWMHRASAPERPTAT